MADALAVIYWHAKVDANDVEFVLAPAGTHPASAAWSSGVLGEHTMWVLDFDCCGVMTQDEEGVEKAARAFYRNDPYFPRPVGEDDEVGRALWELFKHMFS
ncbi:hypothetical protein LTR78_010823 [Recurvomyces mirabilis]|uniref:DUF3669 domain-containing protein n=1 Tax=Recurvomyces mirabilis TaxID=574656 RepID=A0AAE0TLL0_9PEZI|nr:hypothetical protein LTR78_010823 [Recurvomyces mirabilis]KAK5149481.1 hypothetical protein LTS14_010891 [Recurvomyces mirabilis]